MFFEKTEKGYRCNLCPHFCDIEVGGSGTCRVRKADENGIYLDAYGKLTHIAVEPISKKPIFHYLEGTKTLSIGGVSCNQFCNFCENSAYSQKDQSSKTKFFTSKSIVSLALEKNCNSVCMTYNEPIIYYEYLLDVARECRIHNISFVLKTGAYINKEPWKEICNLTSAMNIDFKGMGKPSRRVTGVEHIGILDRIEEACVAGVHVEISIPVYHGIFEGGGFHELGGTLNKLRPDFPIHLLKIYPANRHTKYHTTSDRDLRDIFEILSTYSSRVHFYDGVSI